MLQSEACSGASPEGSLQEMVLAAVGVSHCCGKAVSVGWRFTAMLRSSLNLLSCTSFESWHRDFQILNSFISVRCGCLDFRAVVRCVYRAS